MTDEDPNSIANTTPIDDPEAEAVPDDAGSDPILEDDPEDDPNAANTEVPT